MASTVGLRRSTHRGLARLSLAILAAAFTGELVWGQATGKGPPKPRDVVLQTADGVELAAVYYAQGTDKGKETIPVILLHEFGGSGADYKGLAEFLQGKGFAVLVPDLRGHGGSTSTKSGRELDHKKMPPKLFHGIYVQGGDIDVCKEFLRKENNQEKLNIDKLCLVGAGLGATAAMNWAVEDWKWPVVGGVKQGQDVKAIIMLSPSFNEKSVNVNIPLRNAAVLKELAIYILAGESGKAPDDAKKIHKPIDVARGGTEGEEIKKQLLLQVFDGKGKLPKTNRQGTQLLQSSEKLQVPERIEAFINATVAKQNAPWKERKSPLE
jgi:pimeloyl-ACP methyl ester carboxylesterase